MNHPSDARMFLDWFLGLSISGGLALASSGVTFWANENARNSALHYGAATLMAIGAAIAFVQLMNGGVAGFWRSRAIK